MANHKSAIKRIRINERRRLRNRPIISRARTEIRAAREAIQTGKAKDAREAVLTAIRTLDKAASKGILHKNNASRRKSRLVKLLASLDAGK